MAEEEWQDWLGDEGVAECAKPKRQREDQRGAKRAKLADVASLMEGAHEWEAWEGAMDTTSYTPRRSEKEDKPLWKVLNDLYRKDAAKAKKADAKKLNEVAKARKQMGVGRNQPSLMEQMRVVKKKSSRVAPESTQVEVDTQVCNSSEDIHLCKSQPQSHDSQPW